MISTYRKLLDLLTASERRRLYLLVGMIMLMGLAEMISIASILPFMAVVARPEMLQGDGRVAEVYQWLGFTDPHNFMIALGGTVFALVVVGLLFSTYTTYLIFRYTAMRGYSISSRLMRSYLVQSYPWFLNRHSADLSVSVLAEVNQVIGHSMIASMKLLSQAVLALFLIALLVIAQPLVALIAASVVGFCYMTLFMAARKALDRLGHEKHIANRQRFKLANETFGGIKEVKLLGLEEEYLGRFSDASRREAKALAASAVIGDLPRNILKAVALGGILVFILFVLIWGNGDLSAVLPTLVLYAFAGQRLFPALQQVYQSSTSMRFMEPTLDKLHANMLRANADLDRKLPSRKVATIGLQRQLDLADVEYAYPGAERPAVSGLSLTIPARATVGMVGGTGAGKTTTVDLILGLLDPQKGELRVDGQVITEANRFGWQRAIGYVPQQIFLTDASVAANIAFGVPAKDIDQAAVERAARIAELHDFILSDLPDGYNTMVGERGVRLSGGQRQRIGIARALYHDPDVLILDEATSALDNLTEKAVMDAVHNLGHAKTIIMIAHRLTTVKDCDLIFMLDHGRVTDVGSYDELLNNSQKFRALAAGAV